MKRKFNYKLISCFLAALIGIQSYNAISANKNLVYGDTSDEVKVTSTNSKESTDLKEELGESESELEKNEVDIEDQDNIESSEEELEASKDELENNKEESENYLEEGGNVNISPEEVVEREETEKQFDSQELIDEPEDTYRYEPINSFESVETYANASYPEDVNRDGAIDQKDLDLVATKYNLKSGNSGYSDKYDVNSDGIIDLFDLTLISGKLGTVYGKLIAIDPGHGGSDPGAIGPTGLREKTVVLNVSLMVRDMLMEQGYRVIMTRTGDYRLSENLAEDLKKRAEVANNANADYFVSVHANSFSSSTAHGTETYYHKNLSSSSAAARLAGTIQKELISSLGRYNRGVKTADFSVLRNTNMDAALTELAFISNPEEERLLGSEEFQKNAAKAIVAGIISGIN